MPVWRSWVWLVFVWFELSTRDRAGWQNCALPSFPVCDGRYDRTPIRLALSDRTPTRLALSD